MEQRKNNKKKQKQFGFCKTENNKLSIFLEISEKVPRKILIFLNAYITKETMSEITDVRFSTYAAIK